MPTIANDPTQMPIRQTEGQVENYRHRWTYRRMPRTPARARILIVDDHPRTATMLARAISQADPELEVVSATSGQMALERVKGEAVDLVITDMMMPNMNGLQLIEKLRSSPEGRPAYSVLITGYDIPGLKETARRLKVDETIIKPVRPEHICQIVRKVVEDLRRAEPPKGSTGERKSAKILIADDVADNVALISRYLEREGYAYVSAADGDAALDMARSEAPDLILLDINMPKKNGFEVLREIRGDPALQYMAVIILTAARPDPSDMQYGLSLGADDYVVKPFDRRELLARIKTKLRAQEADAAVRRRYAEVRLLPEIGRELSGRLDIDELANVVLRHTVEIFGAMYGHIVLADGHERYEKTHHVAALPETEVRPPHLDGFMGELEETHQSLILEDTHKDPRRLSAPDDPVGSAVVVPLVGRLHISGLLVLTHEDTSHFKPEDLLLLQAIASQAAVAIEAARLYASARREYQKATAVLESVSDPILVVDARRQLVMLNPAAHELFSDAPVEIGRRLEAGNGFDELLATLDEAITTGRPGTQEVTWRNGRILEARLDPC